MPKRIRHWARVETSGEGRHLTHLGLFVKGFSSWTFTRVRLWENLMVYNTVAPLQPFLWGRTADRKGNNVQNFPRVSIYCTSSRFCVRLRAPLKAVSPALRCPQTTVALAVTGRDAWWYPTMAESSSGLKVLLSFEEGNDHMCFFSTLPRECERKGTHSVDGEVWSPWPSLNAILL